jgi:hypothetical protein
MEFGDEIRVKGEGRNIIIKKLDDKYRERKRKLEKQKRESKLEGYRAEDIWNKKRAGGIEIEKEA